MPYKNKSGRVGAQSCRHALPAERMKNRHKETQNCTLKEEFYGIYYKKKFLLIYLLIHPYKSQIICDKPSVITLLPTS